MKATPVPHLTRRDAGELETNRPKLPVDELAHRLKAYWYAGMKQGEMVKITGYGIDYIKKFTACFSRALNIPYPEAKERQNPEIQVQYIEKKQPKKSPSKNRKSLTVNFQTPITKKSQREYMKLTIGEGLIVPDGAKLIPLSKGYFAFVSEDDFRELSQYKWSVVECRHTNYAIRHEPKTKKRIAMHRQILGLTNPNILTDHKNGNGLDNTRENIRPCTPAQNAKNQRISKKNTSGFKGVSWKDRDLRWQAKIRVDGKYIHLGHFISVIEAAKAYNEAAKKYHGEFANLNEI